MLTKEAFTQWFREALMPRWARCSFNAVQIGDWYWRLKGYETDVLTEAIRRHHAVDEPRRPSLKKVHEYAREHTAQTTAFPARREKPCHPSIRLDHSRVPEAHTYIQCVGKDADGNGPVGWFVPILLWPFHQTYTRQMFDKAAENQRRLHQQNNGGIWEIVSGTTHSRMMQRRGELTGQAERIAANTEKVRRHLQQVCRRQTVESRRP